MLIYRATACSGHGAILDCAVIVLVALVVFLVPLLVCILTIRHHKVPLWPTSENLLTESVKRERNFGNVISLLKQPFTINAAPVHGQ